MREESPHPATFSNQSWGASRRVNWRNPLESVISGMQSSLTTMLEWAFHLVTIILDSAKMGHILAICTNIPWIILIGFHNFIFASPLVSQFLIFIFDLPLSSNCFLRYNPGYVCCYLPVSRFRLSNLTNAYCFNSFCLSMLFNLFIF
jgi:hypothetical protein